MIDKKLLNNLLFSMFWAGSILTTKLALNAGLHPLLFNLQTTLVSSIILIPYIFIFFRNDLKKIRKKEIKIILLLGFVLSIAYILSNQSLKLTTSINYGFLIKTTVIFTPILSMMFLDEKITRKKIFFMFVFLLGTFLISTNGKMIIPKAGDILVIVTALLFSSGVIVTKSLSGKMNPEFAGAIRPISALVFLVIITPIIGTSVVQTFVLDFSILKYVIATSIFGALLSIFLGKSVGSSTASYFTLMNNMTSVFVLIGGIVFLGENMSSIQIIGAAITIFSAIMVQRTDI